MPRDMRWCERTKRIVTFIGGGCATPKPLPEGEYTVCDSCFVFQLWNQEAPPISMHELLERIGEQGSTPGEGEGGRPM